jgi:hypothetical protein
MKANLEGQHKKFIVFLISAAAISSLLMCTDVFQTCEEFSYVFCTYAEKFNVKASLEGQQQQFVVFSISRSAAISLHMRKEITILFQMAHAQIVP